MCNHENVSASVHLYFCERSGLNAAQMFWVYLTQSVSKWCEDGNLKDKSLCVLIVVSLCLCLQLVCWLLTREWGRGRSRARREHERNSPGRNAEEEESPHLNSNMKHSQRLVVLMFEVTPRPLAPEAGSLLYSNTPTAWARRAAVSLVSHQVEVCVQEWMKVEYLSQCWSINKIFHIKQVCLYFLRVSQEVEHFEMFSANWLYLDFTVKIDEFSLPLSFIWK